MFRSSLLTQSRRAVAVSSASPLEGLVGDLVGREISNTTTSTRNSSQQRNIHHIAFRQSIGTPNGSTRNDKSNNNGDVGRSILSFPRAANAQNLLQRQQVRTVFIQTASTPNPESIKFVPSGKTVLETEDGTGYYVSKNDPMEDILKSLLYRDLFKVDGVKAVYLGSDFVTITKYAQNNWNMMRP